MAVELPLGIKFLRSVRTAWFPNVEINSLLWYRISVLTLTFLSYMCYHASRKPLSIVKSYFNQSCANLTPPPDIFINSSNQNTWCDWAPFYGPDAGALLGTLDSAFLFAYAAAMFLSGFVAERMSLRYFLAVGMITSGIYCYLFGLAHKLQIHLFWYFVLVQIFGGVVQSSGWPGVVAVMGNWYGKSKKGLIMGLWNSHTSVGNIVGTLIASQCLSYDWGYSFMVPGVLIAAVGFINFLFLVEHPTDVGLNPACPTVHPQQTRNNLPEADGASSDDSAYSDTELLLDHQHPETNYTRGKEEKVATEDHAIGIIDAVKIPGVIEFSLCLFFSKLVCYTFIYWLPFYINASTTLTSTNSADLSTLFDFGGILGGVFAGAVTDYYGKSATVCCVMLIISIPLLLLYSWIGAVLLWLNIILLFTVGFFVNGPYALITTAVSAELGCHPSLSGNSKALATVTAIIDGTGSIGAAVGPLIAGIVYSFGWSYVFIMLMIANILALTMLLRLVVHEWRRSIPGALSSHGLL
ncbi:solute carrier family 37 (glycerol-3-phosphate transporter), member [Nesidiocoris tenuis]|uniref:Sugar phosphate exchanger 3 n=1 Tax=Nesidiocoris tenuis TaxID=355587 RepID=A0ABN7AE32_9HEMI|nr:solute carrier family 37 (glycerol-3-phosphate transporter), member [Nesidiocoris tenuis]